MNRIKQIVTLFMTLTEKALHSGKKKIDFGQDLHLFRSEIHTIEIIGQANGIHISEIARAMGVTKGAISQRTKILKNKGLIKTVSDPENNSRLLVMLTEQGKRCFVSHREYHEERDKEMFEYLNSLDDNEIKIVEKFLEMANQFCERHI